ncbi:MAG: FAD-binding oxidoreductase, partial [Nitrososphaerota archaeon]|nr:FAD-binding oxidoreductase [Nitrososphaerota archaeon]
MTLAEELVDVLGEENLDSSPGTLERFRVDESVRSASDNTPSFIVTPRDAERVSKVLQIANKYRMPVVAVGYMSSTHGSSVPSKGSIVLDFKGWNEILEIDTDNRLVTVRPGVTIMKLQKELEKHGFFLAHGPSTWFRATVGGAISCGSGGVFHLRYGRPIEQVVSLEVVLPTGEIIETGKKVHEPGFGYDLARVIGPSEGTLGIITKATLRIYPIPEYRLVEGYDFSSVSTAFNAVNALIDSGIFPETILGHNGRSHFTNFMPTVR